MMTALVFIMPFWLACKPKMPDLDFPPGLEPLEDIKVSAPEGTASNPFPQRINLRSAEEDSGEGSYAWVHARGYLHANMADAWKSLRDPNVFVDVDVVAEYSVQEETPEFDYAWLVHYVVDDIVTVEFDMRWYHGTVVGSRSDPEHVVAKWQKVAGTEFIMVNQGSIEFFEVDKADSDVVEVQIIQHLSAARDQEENSINYVEGLYSRWKSDVN